MDQVIHYIDLQSTKYLKDVVRAINHKIAKAPPLDVTVCQIYNALNLEANSIEDLLKYREFIKDVLEKRAEKLKQEKQLMIIDTLKFANEITLLTIIMNGRS